MICGKSLALVNGAPVRCDLGVGHKEECSARIATDHVVYVSRSYWSESDRKDVYAKLTQARAAVLEEAASAFEQRIAWHNDECPAAGDAHPWYACDCEVRKQAAGIRSLKGDET